MAYRPPKKQPQFADLKGVLSQSKKADNPLSQTVAILIERLTQFQGIVVERLDSLDSDLEDATKVKPAFNHYDSPLTDGDLLETELIFANGECIIVQVPI